MRKLKDYPSKEKAQEMLVNPPHGDALSDKQKHFFQALAHGWKPTNLTQSKLTRKR